MKLTKDEFFSMLENGEINNFTINGVKYYSIKYDENDIKDLYEQFLYWINENDDINKYKKDLLEYLKDIWNGNLHPKRLGRMFSMRKIYTKILNEFLKNYKYNNKELLNAFKNRLKLNINI